MSEIKNYIIDILYLPVDFVQYHLRNQFGAPAIIKVLLFAMLFLYIIRGCNQLVNDRKESLPHNQNQNSIPVEKDNPGPAYQI